MIMQLQIEAPERTLTQRQDALLKANKIRTFRANLKRDIKAGRKNIVEVLADPPEEILAMRIMDLLLATPKRGRVKVNNILRYLRIAPSKTVGGLSSRQRKELSSYLYQ